MAVENLPRKNQWAFLDEIEAPMWVDLTLEFDSTYEDKDDEWFHISHPIHQSSAEQLKYILGPSSPELPPSVSKSRGKDYKIRMQAPVACGLTLNKLNNDKILSSKSKSSFIDVVSKKAVENKAFNGNVKNCLDSKSSKSLSGFPDKTKTSTKSLNFGGGESSSKGINTRKASSVEIKGKEKSCSSKSSVGSSLHPQCDETNQNRTDYKNKTSVRRNEKTMSQVSTNKVNRPTVCKARGVQAKSSSLELSLHISREAKKAKDHNKLTRVNVTREVNGCVLPKVATKSTKASRIERCGKENQENKTVLGINSSTKLKEAETKVDNRVTERKVVQKRDRTKVSVPKGNCSSASEVNKFTRKVERVYFR